ncbi:DNA-binding transcriptional regulator [Leifsonia sp. ALI-44-B]|uniref:helix-turn-helix transcriptional regulator n=1 Tax=Leifsonia sp. ALI-44-B TaxID=1933776 RepID=UPI00097C1CB9|nr:WYL domain-containing protein [Leifsonia sp. ALI-44-B]ONI63559.1 DNA-binding transcriptional regulator [Leifsonia sp. ALI-44-B]
MAARTPAPQARDKLAFLLSFVPYLMDIERVSVADAAAHFGVPAEQIRQSVRLIAVSGVPGETTSYQHEDLFDIDWTAFEEHDEIALTHQVAIDDSPRFSAREAAALIAGLQYLSALPGQNDRAVLDSLLLKLSRGASGVPSEVLVGRAVVDSSLDEIRAALTDGRRIEFVYLNSRGEREVRSVDPLRIESVDEDWYVRGWDHARRGVRTFRLDRLSELRTTDIPITKTPADVALPETLFEGSDEDLAVLIEVEADSVPLIAEYIAPDTQPVPHGSRVRVELRLAHYHGLKRLVASLPGVVQVLEPDEARDAVAEWSRQALERYGEASSAS